jgi:hypothetical protein
MHAINKALIGVLLLFLAYCSTTRISGTGSETETGTVIGKVLNMSNSAVPDAHIKLHALRPIVSATLSAMLNDSGLRVVVSGIQGDFRIDSVDAGSYFLEILTADSTEGKAQYLTMGKDSLVRITAFVQQTGSIRGKLDSSQLRSGVNYSALIHEIARAQAVDSTGGFFIKNVPSCSLYTLRLFAGDSLKASSLDTIRVTIEPGKAVVIGDTARDTVRPPIIDSANYHGDSLTVRAILDSNGLIALPIESVTESSGGRITVLKLGQKNLTILPRLIGKLSYLRNLQLGFNRLSLLPDELWTLDSLRILDLSYNKYDSIPSAIGNLKNLEILGLRNVGTINYPSSLWSLPKLYDISLQDTLLTTIPGGIANLKSLWALGISQCKIVSIPAFVFSITNLRILDLSGNKIDSIPKEIGNLVNLTTLLLHDNQIRELPDSIGKLVLLETLTLTNNKLTDLPATITDISQFLTTLYLEGNKLCHLSADIKTWATTYNSTWEANQTCP